MHFNAIRTHHWPLGLVFLILSLMRELLASIACNDLLHPIRLVNKMREESLSFKSVPLALSQLSPLSSATKSGQGCYVGIVILIVSSS